MDLIRLVEEDFKSGKQLPKSTLGDMIAVNHRIKESNKEHIQKLRGTVIRISGHGDQRRFTIRKISDGVGVERIFPCDNLFTEEIHVERYDRARRAKFHYLRNLRGKTTRIRERYTPSVSVK